MAKNEAKIKFTADCQAFNAEIQKANSTMQKLGAELRLTEQQMKTNGASVEALEDKYKILSNQFDASQDKIEALRGKLDAAVKNFGEGSEEANKWRVQLLNAQTAQSKIEQAMNKCNAEIKEQKSAMEQAENAMDTAEDAAKKLDEAIDGAGESAEEASEGFTVMKGALADLVADGISGAIDGLANVGKEAFTMANDIDKAVNTFITKTGESASSAEEFEEVMTSIYNNNFGESFEDIAESMSTVKTTMGEIDGAELQGVTENALLMRDTFDMEVNESIRAVNSMMDQFGITADQAYSLIAQGAQNGLNQNDDLLDTINEYSVQFQDAGYSAEDMFNMLANGVESGTWSVDKLGDAVKEFNIRMSDGSAQEAVEALGFSWEEVSADWSKGGDSAKEVFNMLVNELDGLENTTEGYGIGVGLLGTMYEDLGQDAILALSQTKGEISSTSEALEQLNSVKYDDLGSAFEGIKRNLQTSISEPIKNDVMPAINEFVQDIDWQSVGQTIGNAMSTVADAFIALVDGIRQTVQWMNEHKTLLAVVATGIGIVTAAITAYNVVQGIKTAMDAAQVTTIWGLVAAHVAQAAAAAAALAPYILIVAAIAAVIAIGVLLWKNWDTITEKCSELWGKLTEIWSNIKASVSQKIEELKSAAIEKWNSLKSSVSNAVTALKNTVTSIWNSIKTATSNAFNSVKNLAISAWNSLKSGVQNAVTSAKNAVTSAWNNVKSITSSVFNSVKSTATSIWNSIKSSISNVISGIKSGISSGLTGAKNTVVNILNSIKSKFTSIWDGCKNIVSNAINKVKSLMNFSWSLPKLKLPHFSITGSFSLNPPSMPKIGVSWYKDGGILTKPTIFGINGNELMAGGEAGAEAILPIDRLEGYVVGAIEKTINNSNFVALANAIEELANRPVVMNINGRQFATATASDADNVNGLRNIFKSRGLVIE